MFDAVIHLSQDGFVKDIQWTSVSYVFRVRLTHTLADHLIQMSHWMRSRAADRRKNSKPLSSWKGRRSVFLNQINLQLNNPTKTCVWNLPRPKQWPSPWEQTSVIVVPWTRTFLSLVLPFPLMLKTSFISRRWGLFKN